MRRWIYVAVAVCAIAGAAVLYQAVQAERAARFEVSRENEIRFHLRTLQPVASGWQPVRGPAGYRDLAVWNGGLYIAASNALLRFTQDGKLDRAWRSGTDLPAAPLHSLAVAGRELWIGTEGEGAVLFDGQTFRQLLPEKKEARSVRAILPLATGAVLIGTAAAGVFRFDGAQLTPAHPRLANIPVTALAGTEDSLWIGTRDRGALRLRAGQVETFGEAEGLPDSAVHAIEVSGDSAWVGASTGIAEFQAGRHTRVLGEGLLALSLLRRGDELFAGTLNDGWLRIPLAARMNRLSGAKSAEAGEVRRIAAFGEDVYLLRSDELSVLRSGSLRNALDSAGEVSLSHSNISALALDRSGRLWVGYFDRGLDILSSGTKERRHLENDRIFCVNRIVPSAGEQEIAVATANGLVLFDNAGQERQVLTRADGLAASHVTDVVERAGRWIAGTPAGVTFTGAIPRTIFAFHGLVNNHVYALAIDGPEILAGTLGGLSRLQGETVKANYTTANSPLKANWITAIAGADTEWYLGTYGEGVFQLDSTGRISVMEGIPSGVVVNPNAMAVSDRAIYAGTLEHGLLIWNRSLRNWRATRAGLPSANVTAILYHDNRLYVGTDNGLVQAPESAMGL